MSSGISSEFDWVRSGEQGVLTRPDSIEVEIEMRAFMKRVVLVGVCTMLSCFSVACGKNKSKVDTDRHYVIGTESECSVSTFDEVLYYDGVYMDAGIALQYVDAATGERGLMCFDPSCEHKWRRVDGTWRTSCPALEVVNKALTKVCVYRDGIYFLSQSSKGIGHGIDLVRTGFDVFEPQIVAELAWANTSLIFKNCLVDEDSLFLSYAITHDYSNIEEQGITTLEDRIAEISMVSMKDGKARKLVSKSVPKGDAIISQFVCDDSFLYYSLDYIKNGNMVTEIWQYNLKNDTEILLRTLAGSIEAFNLYGYLYAVVDENYQKDIYFGTVQGEDDILLSDNCSGFSGIIAEDEIYYSRNGNILGIYDKATQKIREFPEYNGFGYITMKEAFRERLYLKVDGEYGPACATLTFEDFKSGNLDKIRLLYENNEPTDQYFAN